MFCEGKLKQVSQANGSGSKLTATLAKISTLTRANPDCKRGILGPLLCQAILSTWVANWENTWPSLALLQSHQACPRLKQCYWFKGALINVKLENWPTICKQSPSLPYANLQAPGSHCDMRNPTQWGWPISDYNTSSGTLVMYQLQCFSNVSVGIPGWGTSVTFKYQNTWIYTDVNVSLFQYSKKVRPMTQIISLKTDTDELTSKSGLACRSQKNGITLPLCLTKLLPRSRHLGKQLNSFRYLCLPSECLGFIPSFSFALPTNVELGVRWRLKELNSWHLDLLPGLTEFLTSAQCRHWENEPVNIT